MIIKKSSLHRACVALLAGLLLAACSEKPEAMMRSAKDYLAKNDNKAAVIQIKNALQANPELPEARFLLGKTLLDSGDAAGAEAELRKALALKYPPDTVMPLVAKALLAQGQAKKLTDELGQTQLSDPLAKADFQTVLASAYAVQGQLNPYQAAVDAALAAQPGFAPTLVVQARQKANQGDFDAALALTDAAIGKSPDNFEAWKLKGDLLRHAKNQLPEALAAYRKTIDIKPDFLAGHSAAVMVLLLQNQLPEAARQLDALTKVAPGHPQTKLLQAHLALLKKEYKQSRDLLQQVLKVAPDNVQTLQLAGLVEYQLDSLAQSEAYFSKALQAAPDMSLARRMLISIYLRTGQSAKALASLQAGLYRENVDPGLYALAGEVYLHSGDAKKAQEYFLKASQQDPNNIKTRISLALMRMTDGQVDTAFEELHSIAAADSGSSADLALISAHLQRGEFDKALLGIDALEKKQANQPLAANLRGRTLLAKKDAAGARKSFEQALAIDPNFFPAVASLAGLDLADKKPEEAKKRFEAVLAKDPKHGQALLALAELAARTGAPKAEIATRLGNAVSANPTDLAPRMLLISFHLRNKDAKLALAAAQEAMAALPDNPTALDALGRAQLAAGEINQAIASFNKLAAMQPLSAQPHVRLADAHMAAKDKTAAAASLRRALEIKPDLQDAQRSSIMLDVDSQNIQSALTTARTMQRQDSGSAAGHVLEGDINASQKNWDSAAAAYRSGLAKQPNSAEMAIKLHSVLQAAGKSAEADKFSATWQQGHPQDAVFLVYLADAAMVRKDDAYAERTYLAAIKLQPDNAVAYNNLAWVSARLKRPEAIAYAEKALALAPTQPAFMDTLAGLLSDQGDYARALDLQARAVAAQPQNPMFRLNLAKIHIKGGNKVLARPELTALAKLGSQFAGQKEVAELLKGL